MADHRLEIVLAAKDVTGRVLKGLGNRLDTLKRNVFSLRGAFVALGAATGMGYAIKRSLDFMDTIGKTADRMGITTDELQKYRYIAERAGVTTQQLDNGIESFAKRLGEARQGTGALYTYLNKLDEQFLAQVTSAGSVDEAFGLIIRRMNNMENAADRAALSAAAFSKRSGVAMVNLAPQVEDLSKRFERLGIAIDEKTIRESEKAIDSITDLSWVMKSNLTRVIGELAPDIARIATDMANWVAANDEFIKNDLPRHIGDAARELKEFLELMNLRSIMGTFNQGVDLAQQGLIDMDAFTKASFVERQRMVDSILEQQRQLEVQIGGRVASEFKRPEITPPGPSFVPQNPFRGTTDEIEKLKKTWLDTQAKLETDINKVGLSDFQQKLIDIQAEADKLMQKYGQIPEAKSFIAEWMESEKSIVAFEAIKELSAQNAAEYKNMMDERLADQQDLTDRIKSLTLSETDYKIWSLNRETEALKEKYAGDKAMLDEITAYHKAAIDDINKSAQQTFLDLSELSMRTAENMQSNFSNLFFDVMKRNFENTKDIGIAIFDSMLRILSDMWAEAAIQKLFGPEGKGGGLFSAIGGWIGGLFKTGGTEVLYTHKGGIIGDSSIPTRTVPAGLFRNAPRLHGGLAPDEYPAILQRGEMVIPANKAGGNNYYVTNHIQAMDAQSFTQYCRRNSGAIVGAWDDDYRRSGRLRNRIRSTL